MNNVSSSAADYSTRKPGELMHLVSGLLAERGLHIRYSTHDDPCSFEIIGIKDVGCLIAVTDYGDAQLDWTPTARGDTDPQAIADMAACLLTGHPAGSGRNRPRQSTESATFKSIVGHDLKARGFEVKLEVFTDERAFQALAVIVAASPGSMDSSKVTIADDGSLLWERDYWPDYAQTSAEPGRPGQLTRLDEIAADAATRLSKAIFIALPQSANSLSGACGKSRQGPSRKQDTHRCACGQEFPTPDDLGDHLSMSFPFPEDDIGDDGKLHYEISSDTQTAFLPGTPDAPRLQARSTL